MSDVSSGMEEDCDLYGDLPDLQNENKKTLQKLESEVKLWKDRCVKFKGENEKLKRENKSLQTNISTLIKTAQGEVQRKDKMIAELRREKDSIVFRRGGKRPDNNRNFHNAGADQHDNNNRDHYQRDDRVSASRSGVHYSDEDDETMGSAVADNTVFRMMAPVTGNVVAPPVTLFSKRRCVDKPIDILSAVDEPAISVIDKPQLSVPEKLLAISMTSSLNFTAPEKSDILPPKARMSSNYEVIRNGVSKKYSVGRDRAMTSSLNFAAPEKSDSLPPTSRMSSNYEVIRNGVSKKYSVGRDRAKTKPSRHSDNSRHSQSHSIRSSKRRDLRSTSSKRANPFYSSSKTDEKETNVDRLKSSSLEGSSSCSESKNNAVRRKDASRRSNRDNVGDVIPAKTNHRSRSSRDILDVKDTTKQGDADVKHKEASRKHVDEEEKDRVKFDALKNVESIKPKEKTRRLDGEKVSPNFLPITKEMENKMLSPEQLKIVSEARKKIEEQKNTAVLALTLSNLESGKKRSQHDIMDEIEARFSSEEANTEYILAQVKTGESHVANGYDIPAKPRSDTKKIDLLTYMTRKKVNEDIKPTGEKVQPPKEVEGFLGKPIDIRLEKEPLVFFENKDIPTHETAAIEMREEVEEDNDDDIVESNVSFCSIDSQTLLENLSKLNESSGEDNNFPLAKSTDGEMDFENLINENCTPTVTEVGVVSEEIIKEIIVDENNSENVDRINEDCESVRAQLELSDSDGNDSAGVLEDSDVEEIETTKVSTVTETKELEDTLATAEKLVDPEIIPSTLFESPRKATQIHDIFDDGFVCTATKWNSMTSPMGDALLRELTSKLEALEKEPGAMEERIEKAEVSLEENEREEEQFDDDEDLCSNDEAETEETESSGKVNETKEREVKNSDKDNKEEEITQKETETIDAKKQCNGSVGDLPDSPTINTDMNDQIVTNTAETDRDIEESVAKTDQNTTNESCSDLEEGEITDEEDHIDKKTVDDEKTGKTNAELDSRETEKKDATEQRCRWKLETSNRSSRDILSDKPRDSSQETSREKTKATVDSGDKKLMDERERIPDARDRDKSNETSLLETRKRSVRQSRDENIADSRNEKLADPRDRNLIALRARAREELIARNTPSPRKRKDFRSQRLSGQYFRRPSSRPSSRSRDARASSRSKHSQREAERSSRDDPRRQPERKTRQTEETEKLPTSSAEKTGKISTQTLIDRILDEKCGINAKTIIKTQTVDIKDKVDKPVIVYKMTKISCLETSTRKRPVLAKDGRRDVQSKSAHQPQHSRPVDSFSTRVQTQERSRESSDAVLKSPVETSNIHQNSSRTEESSASFLNLAKVDDPVENVSTSVQESLVNESAMKINSSSDSKENSLNTANAVMKPMRRKAKTRSLAVSGIISSASPFGTPSRPSQPPGTLDRLTPSKNSTFLSIIDAPSESPTSLPRSSFPANSPILSSNTSRFVSSESTNKVDTRQTVFKRSPSPLNPQLFQGKIPKKSNVSSSKSRLDVDRSAKKRRYLSKSEVSDDDSSDEDSRGTKTQSASVYQAEVNETSSSENDYKSESVSSVESNNDWVPPKRRIRNQGAQSSMNNRDGYSNSCDNKPGESKGVNPRPKIVNSLGLDNDAIKELLAKVGSRNSTSRYGNKRDRQTANLSSNSDSDT